MGLLGHRTERLFTIHAALDEPFTPEDFTDEEKWIGKTTERFVLQDVLPKKDMIEAQKFDASYTLFRKAGELGLLGVEIPELYGGLSLNKRIAGIVAEKMGAGGSFSVSFNIHAGVGTLPILYYGSEEQKECYLPRLSTGEWIGAYALTEPEAGSDALSGKTTAVRTEGGWLLNGEKQWITNATLASIFIVFAKGSEGMTAFLIERDSDGLSIGKEEQKMGIKGSSTASLFLNDVFVPGERVLGTVGGGHHIALNTLNMARLKLAFSNVGAAKRALGLATCYANERKQFKQPLSSFKMIQEKLADMAVSIYGAESAAYRTAGDLDDALLQNVDKLRTFAAISAVNKIGCSEMLSNVVDEAVQIHGGYGYMREYEVETLYRDARISRIFEGTNEINRLTVSRSIVKQASTIVPCSKKFSEHLSRNERLYLKGKELFCEVLKAVTNIDVEKEQEYMRLLSDVIMYLYTMESALLRERKAAEQNVSSYKFIALLTDALCEKLYRKVEEAGVTILANAGKEHSRETSEFIQLPLRYYDNGFQKKREIANELITKSGYFM